MTDAGTAEHAIPNDGVVREALSRAAALARREYVRAGLSMPVWRSGRLVWIKPPELQRYDSKDPDAPRTHAHSTRPPAP